MQRYHKLNGNKYQTKTYLQSKRRENISRKDKPTIRIQDSRGSRLNGGKYHKISILDSQTNDQIFGEFWKNLPGKKGNKCGRVLKGRKQSLEDRVKKSFSKIGDRNPMKNPETARKVSLAKMGKPNPKVKAHWERNRDAQMRAMMRGAAKKPNKLELKLDQLIKENNLPFKYVGDWQFSIDAKCPDFIDTDGSKRIIELFGTYWHTIKARETAEERISHFARFGYTTLIIMESEMVNPRQVVEKITIFCNSVPALQQS